jgi:hypothetical protein
MYAQNLKPRLSTEPNTLTGERAVTSSETLATPLYSLVSAWEISIKSSVVSELALSAQSLTSQIRTQSALNTYA